MVLFRGVTAVMAGRKQPVTFRNRKLSFSAPMVLHSGGCGRVGRRRTIFVGARRLVRRAPFFVVWAGLGGAVRRSLARPADGTRVTYIGTHRLRRRLGTHFCKCAVSR